MDIEWSNKEIDVVVGVDRQGNLMTGLRDESVGEGQKKIKGTGVTWPTDGYQWMADYWGYWIEIEMYTEIGTENGRGREENRIRGQGKGYKYI